MRLRNVMMWVAALVAMSVACARSPEPEPAAGGSEDTATVAAPDTAARAVMLVEALPAGIEGLELAENGLRVQKGYEFVKDTDSTFALRRMGGSNVIRVGGCGCKVGAGCVPFMTDDGIIICISVLCNTCGLAVIGPTGASFEIARYEKP